MKKKVKLATALEYKHGEDRAPRVTAIGSGYIAEAIIKLAQEHNIPLHESPEVAAMLSQLEPGDEIPEQLYIAVAEILAFIYNLSDAKQREKGLTPPT
ncbi:EscU/YscU/HrcU family type III secretion system export apparatus switch protein [Balneatrix alpica]|uniref:Flagellar biosynthetic protein FlhB n=1 Tax=Balneatrix alpica TaxID=75684 RepID=A0ABV5ZG97_9GAMM|nr:EscU/YscU/HrcU family type III secretion system export apparatus switch protein [Balneatrix alpica]